MKCFANKNETLSHVSGVFINISFFPYTQTNTHIHKSINQTFPFFSTKGIETNNMKKIMMRCSTIILQFKDFKLIQPTQSTTPQTTTYILFIAHLHIKMFITLKR